MTATRRLINGERLLAQLNQLAQIGRTETGAYQNGNSIIVAPSGQIETTSDKTYLG